MNRIGLAVAGLVACGLSLGAASASVTFESRSARLVLDDRGRSVSLKETATGRELVDAPVSFVALNRKGGALSEPVACVRARSGEIVFSFTDGELALAVSPFDGGWRFTTLRLTVPDVETYRYGRIRTVCRRWRGDLVNAWSDERSFVCTRGYEEGSAFRTDSSGLVEGLAHREDLSFANLRFGTAGGPRADAVPSLRAMTCDAGLPHSRTGGAWALGAPENRRSYLMAYGLEEATCDDWIELCLRGGYATLHFDECWTAYGHYETDPARFPGGREGLEACVKRAHDAGLTCDIHTLTACIGWKDAWLTPECTDDVMTLADYTLAEELPADATTKTLVVRERPASCHDFVMTYLGNGNLLKVGTELVQYTGVSTNAPWTFTGCTRGAFGTTVRRHAAGARVVYPKQRFGALLVDADKPLVEPFAKVQGDLFGVCGFDQLYLDGADGIEVPRKVDRLVRKIFGYAAAHGRAPLYEDSLWTSSLWWFHSRIGANDYVHWGAKRTLDARFADYMDRSRKANFLEPEMGWWAVMSDGASRGIPYRLDEHEYMASRCAGHDAAFSTTVHGPGAIPACAFRPLTVMGWYERFRFARAFSDETRARFRVPGDEYRLRLDDDGVWRIRPLACSRHSATAPDRARWTVPSDGARTAVVRVDALENGGAWDGPGTETLLDPREVKTFTRESARDVSVTAACETDAEHGAVLRMTATNAGSKRRGPWACVTRAYPPGGHVELGERRSFGLWVKGDGSGALLNVQLHAPRVFSGGRSEHHVRLDFRGWKYVELCQRERDCDDYRDYGWPYDAGRTIDYPVSRCGVSKLGAVNLYLNDIPAGGRADVSVSAVRMLQPVKGVRLRDVTLEVNGRTLAVPFALAAREYAELDGGYWTRWTVDGRPLERVPAPEAVRLKPGANAFAFSARPDRPVLPRAAVTVLALADEAYPALAPTRSAETEAGLAYEAVEPAWYAPSRGFDVLPDLVCRKGERARVSFEIYGPTAPFRLSVGGETRAFPFALAKGEYLTCRDGRNWQLRRVGMRPRRIVRTGTIEPFAPVAGKVPVAFACDDPSRADAHVDLAKHYLP